LSIKKKLTTPSTVPPITFEPYLPKTPLKLLTPAGGFGHLLQTPKRSMRVIDTNPATVAVRNICIMMKDWNLNCAMMVKGWWTLAFSKAKPKMREVRVWNMADLKDEDEWEFTLAILAGVCDGMDDFFSCVEVMELKRGSVSECDSNGCMF
jgi:hypothetical protein